MKKLNVKFAILFPLILSTVIAIAAESKNNDMLSNVDIKKLNTTYADTQLLNIRDDLLLLAYVTTEFSKKNNTEVLKQKIAMSILGKITMVKTLDPYIEALGGNALVTLCLLTQPENRAILHGTGGPYAAQVAKAAENYLIGVEAIVRARIARLQQTMKGSGCYLTPQ